MKGPVSYVRVRHLWAEPVIGATVRTRATAAPFKGLSLSRMAF